MPTYFVSELGAGLQDGTSPDNAWSVADMNAAAWSTLGLTDGAGKDIYFLDEITTICAPTFGAGGADGDLTIIRGDYPGRTALFTSSGGIIFNSSRPYIRYKSLHFKDIDSTAINMATGDYQEATESTFDNIKTGVFLNSSEFSLVYNNTFNEGPNTDYCIRAQNTAHDYDIHDNTVNGYITPLALATGDDNSTPTHTSIQASNNGSANGKIHHNRINNVWGDGIQLVHTLPSTTPSLIDIYSNIVGPRVKTPLNIEGGEFIETYNNTFIMDEFFTDPDPTFKIGNQSGGGTPPDNCITKNNIIIADQRLCMACDHIGVNCTFENNVYFNNRSDDLIINYDEVGTGMNSYTLLTIRSTYSHELNGKYEDPLLDSAYVPMSGSPCVAAGIKWWSGVNKEGFNGEPFSDFDTDIGAIQSTHGPFHPKNL